MSKSIMHGSNISVTWLEEDDTIPNLKLPEIEDDEPTVKVQVPVFHPQVEVRYPGLGLVIALAMGAALWFIPCYYFLMWVIHR